MTNQVKDAIVMGVLLTTLMGVSLGIGYNIGKIDTAHERALNQPTIIWNDDKELIPRDGTWIELQETVGDTIYVGNID